MDFSGIGWPHGSGASASYRAGATASGGVTCRPAGAEYVALCDVDANVRAKGVKTVEAAQGKAPKVYTDMREALVWARPP